MEHEEIKKLLEEYFFKVSVTTNGDLFLQVYNEDDTIPAMQSMAIIAEKLKELGKQEGIPKRCTKCNNRFLQNDHIHITRNGAFHTNCYKVNNPVFSKNTTWLPSSILSCTWDRTKYLFIPMFIPIILLFLKLTFTYGANLYFNLSFHTLSLL